LWLPVVVSAVAVFVVSAIVHMVLRYHRADYKRLSDEDSVAEAVRKVGPPPGLYFIPYCAEMAQMKDTAMRKKFEDGPVAHLIVLRNGLPGMGKNLVQWFLLCFLVSLVTAYVARHTLSVGANGLEVMRLTGTVAFAAYAFGYLQDSIWKGIPWSNSLRGLIDAVLYALTTGLVFRWLWPV
jgi:Flp pilus assembly protein TadB